LFNRRRHPCEQRSWAAGKVMLLLEQRSNGANNRTPPVNLLLRKFVKFVGRITVS
jgi:hypothetical protein